MSNATELTHRSEWRVREKKERGRKKWKKRKKAVSQKFLKTGNTMIHSLFFQFFFPLIKNEDRMGEKTEEARERKKRKDG